MKLAIEESVLRQAIETLQFHGGCWAACADCNKRAKQAITALRTAIKQMEKVEPVAWVGEGDTSVTLSNMEGVYDYKPLYTHPAPAVPEEPLPAVCPHCLCVVEGVPEGWQLVPKEPTAEMELAGKHSIKGAADECERNQAICAYKRMISAAPTPGEVR